MTKFFIKVFSIFFLFGMMNAQSQIQQEIQNTKGMTPEIMLTLKRLSIVAKKPSQEVLIIKKSQPHLDTEKSTHEYFFLDLKSQKETPLNIGGKNIVQWDTNGLYATEDHVLYLSKNNGISWQPVCSTENADQIKVSPDGKKIAFTREVQLEKVLAKEIYADTPNSTAQIYTDLNHRHWDSWYEGKYNHVFIKDISTKKETDLLEGKAYDSPQKPFGGAEDYLWTADSQSLIFVTKEKSGKAYAESTNTDIFLYNISSGSLTNLTQGMRGYDVLPKLSPDGKTLAFLSMARDGYEADKNDLVIYHLADGKKENLTKDWDESVTGDYQWSADGKHIYFSAAYRGVSQLFQLQTATKKITQLTKDHADVNDIIATLGNRIYFTGTDFNHNSELFVYDVQLKNKKQITQTNADIYTQITPSASELKLVKTTDGKGMGVWMVYPPDFNPQKKYPVLLYCQGGPQSALTQFFSYRWNMAVMAAQGYIVVAPNRRGMQGWGVKWNEEISRDWGGQPIRDYLSAADYAKSLPYVDSSRMAAVGASYGGYSVFMLAGVHDNRFKTFIAHDGLFDMKSWYLTTEELWFANWDNGSPYDEPLPKAYTDYNPSNHVKKWNRPIMIIQGGKDFRVGYEQGQEAFQAARLMGLKSKFLYFPNENHWVLQPQNALVWQREFFKWLKETL